MWERCWSIGIVILGFTEEGFFRKTPRQFHLLLDQHRERMEHQELLAGIIASEVANRSQRHPEKWVVPFDFMPSKSHKEVKRRSRARGQKVSNDIRKWVNSMAAAGRVITTNPEAQNG